MSAAPSVALPPRIDHIGLALWSATAAWKRRFVAGMVQGGFAWFTEGRGELLAHVDPDGTPQADIVRRAGTSRQAVQQMLDSLVAEGVLARQPDPADGRGNRIVLTAHGARALAHANRVKRRLDAFYRRRLGHRGFGMLRRLLQNLPG
jgi:DNA-binding MarR family transcriptional regulator